MRKVVFNATILNDKPTGLGVYCNNVLSRIDDSLLSYILYTDEFSRKNDISSKDITLRCQSNSRIKSIILRNYSFKSWLKKNKNKLLFHYSPTQHGVTLKGIKQIITIHDLMPLYFPKGRIQQYIYYKYFLKRVIKNSELIITCSNNTKNDILREYNVNPDKVKVVYNGFDRPKEVVNKEFSKKYIKSKYGIEDYIFMMGIHYEYKNLHSVIEAYDLIKDKIDNKIVIAGGYNGKYGQSLINLVKQKKLEDRIIFLGYIPNEDKDMLYQAAKLFVYPSKYEGFGLPVLEAMINETAVLCSNSSSLPEVVGDAAYKFDPYSIGDIKTAILNILSLNEYEYENYVKNGLKQTEKFSWEKCSSEIEDIIKSIITQEDQIE
ncbi:TPA: glycosyltransferase family 4 protein [Clostridium perfringens]|nr:glycosyltransferase family 4 protein [Clostridium perfringens]